MSEVFQIVNSPITCHAFNADRSQVALCPSTSDLQIYQRSGDSWTLINTLKGHDKPITSVDWGVKTNRIVTCAADRNAYVWTLDDASATWKPTLVLLRLNRAATFVRWSPQENKFAVASGARCISVGYFEAENDWWISKHLKKPIRSTVLCLEWHPNNVLLAAGSADMKARVYSAYIKGLDSKPKPTPWGERLPFSTLCGEFYNGHGGWIHGVAFSPDGNSLAWVGHDSSLSIADPGAGADIVQEVRTTFLPFTSVMWLSATSIVVAGHDYQPLLFQKQSDGKWRFAQKLDTGDGKALKKKSSAGGTLANNAALAKFRQMDSHAQNGPQPNGAGSGQNSSANLFDVNTTHSNCIKSILLHEGTRDSVTKFSTSGLDGKIAIWNKATLESAIAGLKI